MFVGKSNALVGLGEGGVIVGGAVVAVRGRAC